MNSDISWKTIRIKLKAMAELAIYLLVALTASHRETILDHYDNDSSKVAAVLNKLDNLAKTTNHKAQSKQVAAFSN